jgi:hypothetical protein
MTGEWRLRTFIEPLIAARESGRGFPARFRRPFHSSIRPFVYSAEM